LVIVIFGGSVYIFRERIADILKPSSSVIPVPVAAPAPTTVGITVTSASVLQKISQIGQLESVEMKISTVVTAKKEGTTWWKFGQDAQTTVLIGEGTVRAGVNLGDLHASDIVISADGKSVTIKLPAAAILATNLQKTQIYDIKTGLFGIVNIDPKLLDEARVAAREKLQATACESDILQQATDSSRRQMENLITMLGLKAEITSTSPAACPTSVVE
jgi:hypothetical protein